MFRLREKVKYMALGALITLAGFVLGSVYILKVLTFGIVFCML